MYSFRSCRISFFLPQLIEMNEIITCMKSVITASFLIAYHHLLTFTYKLIFLNEISILPRDKFIHET